MRRNAKEVPRARKNDTEKEARSEREERPNEQETQTRHRWEAHTDPDECGQQQGDD